MKPYYERGSITIYCGDALEVLPMLSGVNVTITDPPYESEAHTLQRRVKRKGGVMEVGPLEFGPMTPELRDAAARLIAERTNTWVLTFCQVEGAPIWRQSYEAHGLNYRRTCIWVKPDGMPQYSGDRPGMGYETLLAMHAPGASTWNGGGRHGVFTHSKGSGALPNEHPTQKPLPLMKELVRLFSDENSLILDPFMGSGTTLVAAKNLGRKAIGIEIEERYCEIAAKRLSQEVLNFEATP